LNATVVYDHVAPFARRAIPKRRNHRTPIPANLDDGIAVMKDLRIHYGCHLSLTSQTVGFPSGGTEVALLLSVRQFGDGGDPECGFRMVFVIVRQFAVVAEREVLGFSESHQAFSSTR
jgi:hypothetical protein